MRADEAGGRFAWPGVSDCAVGRALAAACEALGGCDTIFALSSAAVTVRP